MNPHELLNTTDLEGSMNVDQTMYSHTIPDCHEKDTPEKLHYIYQHIQYHEKVHTLDKQINTQDNDTTLYPYINNDVEYGIFEDVIGSYYGDSEINDDFCCDQSCYRSREENAQLPSKHLTPCTHAYDHISQQIHDLNSTAYQQQLHDMEEDASLFTTDTGHSCDFNIQTSTQNCIPDSDQLPKAQPHNSMHFYTKHKYRNLFGDSNINYHDFNTGDALSSRTNIQLF